MTAARELAIEVKGLDVRFGSAHAVKDVSFAVERGANFGIVGESGSGKSTILRVLAGLNAIWSGDIRMLGKPRQRRPARAFYRSAQMVFQDPFGSLHPKQTVDSILAEPLAIHGIGDGAASAERRIQRALEDVGLDGGFRFRYPHQLSGGQRQRVAIARALILEPPILLLDEPTSALDVSIQAEILNLLQDLGRRRDLTMVLVSHNLAVVAHLCRRVAVMTEGAVVEETTAEALRAGTVREPYTADLLRASRGYRREAAPGQANRGT
jgi:peptide/nickel transport system ATP-binding protein